MSTWTEKDKRYIWHPFSPLDETSFYPTISSAKGVYLITEDGQKIIDGISSWWVNLHGHSNEVIAKAVAEQAATLEHVIFAGFTHKPAIELAERLLHLLPPNQSKLFFSDNGSTSVEVALKMSIQYWFNKGIERKKVIALHGAYHGDTFGAMSVGERGPFVAPFNAHLFEVAYLDFPMKGKEMEILKQFELLLQSNEVAAFIFEPLLQGASGMRTYSPDVLNELITMAQQQDVLCIADEVMTGFGRTGKLFASDYLKTAPDLFCLSKGLTGGTMALGITSCSEKIVSAFRNQNFDKTFFHGHSFTANPIACAASIASLKLLETDGCKKKLEDIHQQHLSFQREIQLNPKILDVRVLGTVLAIELVTKEPSSYFNTARVSLYQFFLERNILLRPLGNVIYILPPYVITNDELNLIYTAIRELLSEW